jgi:AAA15 family ATPase/GTPase
MKMDRVEISNFRSIKDATIRFDNRCQMILGMNESGKSNVLSALSLLKQDKMPTKDDIRDALPDETEQVVMSVKFIFHLEKEEIEGVKEVVSPMFYGFTKSDVFMTMGSEDLNFDRFCQHKNSGLYSYNSSTNKKAILHYRLASNFKIGPNVYKVKSPKSVVEDITNQIPWHFGII